LSEALLHSAHTEDIEVVLARNELMSEIPWMNQMLINIQATFHLKRMLDQADLHITPSRLLMFSFMAGMLGCTFRVGFDGVHSAHDLAGLLVLVAADSRLVQTQETFR
jgi:predicted Co/Zn/Cd cation transporter (cation efflux family)